AASIAFPPAASISAPAADASGWLVTTIPRLPVAGCFSQLNVVPACVRQSRSAICQPSLAPHSSIPIGMYRPFVVLPRGPMQAVSRRRAAGPAHTLPDWACSTVREYSRHLTQENLGDRAWLHRIGRTTSPILHQLVARDAFAADAASRYVLMPERRAPMSAAAFQGAEAPARRAPDLVRADLICRPR